MLQSVHRAREADFRLRLDRMGSTRPLPYEVKSLSLEIYIYFVSQVDFLRISLQSVFGMFLPHIARWRALRVRVHDELLSHSTAHFLKSHTTPILELVELDAALDADDMPRDRINDVDEDCLYRVLGHHI